MLWPAAGLREGEAFGERVAIWPEAVDAQPIAAIVFDSDQEEVARWTQVHAKHGLFWCADFQKFRA